MDVLIAALVNRTTHPLNWACQQNIKGCVEGKGIWDLFLRYCGQLMISGARACYFIQWRTHQKVDHSLVINLQTVNMWEFIIKFSESYTRKKDVSWRRLFEKFFNGRGIEMREMRVKNYENILYTVQNCQS